MPIKDLDKRTSEGWTGPYRVGDHVSVMNSVQSGRSGTILEITSEGLRLKSGPEHQWWPRTSVAYIHDQ